MAVNGENAHFPKWSHPLRCTTYDSNFSATPSLASENDVTMPQSPSTPAEARQSMSDVIIGQLKAELVDLRRRFTDTNIVLAQTEAASASKEAALADTKTALINTQAALADTSTALDDTEAALAEAGAALIENRTKLGLANREIQRLKDQLHMKRIVDSLLKTAHTPTAQTPVTPPSRLRPVAPPFVPGSAGAPGAAAETPTKQTPSGGAHVPIKLPSFFYNLDDDTFESLMLGRNTERLPTVELPVVEKPDSAAAIEKMNQPASAITTDKPPFTQEAESKADEIDTGTTEDQSSPRQDLDEAARVVSETTKGESLPAQETESDHTRDQTSVAEARSGLINRPLLELPASFLSRAAKYQSDARAGATVTQVVPSTSVTARKISQLLKENLPPTELNGKRIFFFAPTDFDVKWLVNTKFDLYGDMKRFNVARNDVAQRSVYDLWFWRNGLRYTPEDPVEGNAFRTIMIEEIPIGTSPKQVLDQVVGGPLESFQLCDTVSITGSLTARIVYTYQEAAYDMINHVRHLKLQGREGIFINRSKVHVIHVTTEATTPPPSDLAKDIYEYGFTRVLRLTRLTPTQATILESKLSGDAVHIRELDEAEKCESEVVRCSGAGAGDGFGLAFDVELRSVKDADNWKARLERDEDFKGARLGIGRDPCDRVDDAEGVDEVGDESDDCVL